MKNKKHTCILTGVLTALAMACTAQAQADVVDNSFYPYRESTPNAPGLTTGMSINQANVAQFRDIIDPAFYNFIEQGWVEIKVAETTSFDLHPNYVEASRAGLGNVSLGAKPGELNGWQAGRPGHSRKSRMPTIRVPARNSPGTTSTATTGATARPSTRSTGSTGT